jgi:hypothetical protein
MDLSVIITQPVSALASKRERKKQCASVIDIKTEASILRLKVKRKEPFTLIYISEGRIYSLLVWNFE